MPTLQGILQLHNHSPIILHRDLKSPNLLVDKHWRVKVGDFNLSRVMEGSAVLSSITANNPRWLAPEVRLGLPAGPSHIACRSAGGLLWWEAFLWPAAQCMLSPVCRSSALALHCGLAWAKLWLVRVTEAAAWQ